MLTAKYIMAITRQRLGFPKEKTMYEEDDTSRRVAMMGGRPRAAATGRAASLPILGDKSIVGFCRGCNLKHGNYVGGLCDNCTGELMGMTGEKCVGGSGHVFPLPKLGEWWANSMEPAKEEAANRMNLEAWCNIPIKESGV